VSRRNRVAPRVKLEASGGVKLATVSALAQTGVDRISVGVLTHSAPALDLALDFDLIPALHKGAHRARAVEGTET
jgi:nicotinate-nucleotide pyrophosphorylase (carboxylating)